MEPIRISSPADAISYMGHSLGYWPKESLVCVALEGKTLGPTSHGARATPSPSPP